MGQERVLRQSPPLWLCLTMPSCPTIRRLASRFTLRRWRGRARPNPVRARPHGTAPMSEGVPGGALPLRAPTLKRTLRYSCAILLRGLVFENVRQRVGCVSACSPSEMSIAVEHGRFLLTAKQLRRDILTEASVSSNLYLSGGDS
jgi:hypothetical protein